MILHSARILLGFRKLLSKRAPFLAKCYSGAPPLQPPQDVILFKHQRPGFFRLLWLFCLGQGGFWVYLGHYGFSSLRDTERSNGAGATSDTVQGPGGGNSSPGGKTLNLGSSLWRYGFTLTCFTVGSLIMATGFLFSQRSVSKVLLHRGGQMLTFNTSAPFGAGSCFTVPLRHVSCMAHRSEVPSMIPLKIKGRPLYFLLDKQGQVFNAKLFDITVGAYRKL
ncbi:transmembrane protein 223 [Ambystoma mexicanum]|uniref:transmembrane protein 223 n=1 Tax=Ambystoma mexicanum TaxID=8296 RepID=UPI0037E72886